jgi:hypothetical protein
MMKVMDTGERGGGRRSRRLAANGVEMAAK